MPKKKGAVALPFEKEEIIKDYRLAYQSRQASLISRREVASFSSGCRALPFCTSFSVRFSRADPASASGLV